MGDGDKSGDKYGSNSVGAGALDKAAVHTVLIYGGKSREVTGVMLKLLNIFHNRASRKIAGNTAQCTTGREWEWPPVGNTLETAGVFTIKEFIRRRQATIESGEPNRMRVSA